LEKSLPLRPEKERIPKGLFLSIIFPQVMIKMACFNRKDMGHLPYYTLQK